MQLCIDAADDHPGIALAVDGVLRQTFAWQTERNHSVELLPNIDRMLAETGQTKGDITAVFVDLGPGGYAALRVGVSIAKGLSHGLGVPIVGVGRLELDAWAAARDAHASNGARTPARIIAVHRAGRGELAWAAYNRNGDAWTEESPPQITKAEAFATIPTTGDILTGDIDADLEAIVTSAGATTITPTEHRAVALSAVGHRLLAAGAVDDAMTLVPLYVRAPAIGPQR